MKSYDLITPEGTRDLLFDECVARKEAEDKLRAVFTAHGYSEVITPALEFYDVFNNKTRSFRQEDMYKLTDGKGRLMAMRPDSTMPIARIVATRLRDGVFPLKLFCSQNIYRCNPKMAGRDDEFMQSGVEIIGGDEKRSDLEALSLAAQVLNSCSSDDVRLEIGDNTFYKLLLEKLDIDDEETVRSLIESKNTPDLTQFIKENVDSNPEKRRYSEILLQLPDLFGGAEVFDKAEKLFAGTALSDRLTELKETFDALRKLEAEDKITVDLGLVNKAEYYTGIVFRGYIEEYGQAVLSGGRYDTLIGSFGADDMPAVGFAVNVNAIAAANLRSNRSAKARHAEVLVFAADEDLIDGISHCTKLISKGISAEFSTCPTLDAAMEYAKANKIGRIDIIDKDKNEQPVTMTL